MPDAPIPRASDRRGRGQRRAGSRRQGRGRGRGQHGRHRSGLVKSVAFVAATVAGSMLVLRGNDALDRLDRPVAPDSKAVAPAAAADAPDPGRVLQIVAHPDDDLYFMNRTCWARTSGGAGRGSGRR
ncbi:hypothetical protein [Streptomyces sp. NPDC059874]|uniref:hypothetical protein n=1 Tax=Streptomyces sp. NPDC059874 TaxID=3346983 RepID=UPI00364F1944